MFKITFYIDKANSNKEGFAPIKVNISLDYKDISKTIGRVKPGIGTNPNNA